MARRVHVWLKMSCDPMADRVVCEDISGSITDVSSINGGAHFPEILSVQRGQERMVQAWSGKVRMFLF